MTIYLGNLAIQSRNLNFVTSASAMNRFAPTKVTKFKVRDCRSALLTFLGENIVLHFYPENDLPTHKNWMKEDKILKKIKNI